MVLSRVFSDYRDEWAVGDFNERFVRPPYYDQFVGNEPVFLVGGRGTGKTVALRSMHFRNSQGPQTQLGIYIKAFKNRVQAFSAANLNPDVQVRAFEHYMNLICCYELAQLCLRLQPSLRAAPPLARSVGLAARHFGLKRMEPDPAVFVLQLRHKIAELSAFINDPTRVDRPAFSQGELPVVDYARDVHDLTGGTKTVYICIDEWENLSRQQQEALNRWIKNCETPITYKIGVREGGIKTTDTGGGNDPLHSPADYVQTRISGSSMRSFCRDVVEQRLACLAASERWVPSTLTGLLESLDRHEEAERLGARAAVERKISGLSASDAATGGWLRRVSLGDAYLAMYEAERTGRSVGEVVGEAINDPARWTNTKNNYGHLSLFSVTRGQKGSSRQKYYAGSRTFLGLSDGNVRYLLELLDEAVLLLIAEQGEESDSVPISAEVQTMAAINVARRHLRQIEVLSDRGPELLRLVVALGTAFGALAREPRQRAPEQTSFTVRGPKGDVDAVTELLNEGCSVLAFVRDTTTKRTSATELRDDEYWLHPILTPHFSMSHRKKRKVELDARVLRQVPAGSSGANDLVRKIVGSLGTEDSQHSLF